MADQFIRCIVTVGETGIERFEDAEGQIHAYRNKSGYRAVTRLASKGMSPYLQILPCPWCGTESDRQHDTGKHTGSSG